MVEINKNLEQKEGTDLELDELKSVSDTLKQDTSLIDNLQKLNPDSTKNKNITDVSALQKLTNLPPLDLENTGLTEEWIENLRNLDGLTELDLEKKLEEKIKTMTKSDPVSFFQNSEKILGQISKEQYNKLVLLAFQNIVKIWNSDSLEMEKACGFLRDKWVKFSDATPVFSLDKENNIVMKQDYNTKRMSWYTMTTINPITFKYTVDKIRIPNKQ